MKVLNLYAGLGGNRRLWEGADVVAVEWDKEIADVYRSLYPTDDVVVGDAHGYLEAHYQEFDLIWSSPPCQSHSKVRMMASKAGSYAAVMPDMNLWAEILFLQHFAKGKWVVENVLPYYKPFIAPTSVIGRHLFWANFDIPPVLFRDYLTHNERGMSHKGIFDLRGRELNHRKDQLIRNSVPPRIGLYVFNCSQVQAGLFNNLAQKQRRVQNPK